MQNIQCWFCQIALLEIAKQHTLSCFSLKAEISNTFIGFSGDEREVVAR